MTYIAIPAKAALLVRVEIKEEDNVFVATSPDLNIVVTAHNLGDEFHDGVKAAIRQNLEAMGQPDPITVIRAIHPERDTGYWHFVAIPRCVLDQEQITNSPAAT